MSSSLLVASVVHSHIEAIRSVKSGIFLHSKFIVIPESNLPGCADDVRRAVKRLNLNYVLFMNEDSPKNSKNKLIEAPGFRTTKDTKPIMVELFIKVLRSKNIIFYQEFIISKKEFTFTQIPLKDEYHKQMKSFSRIQIISKNPEIGTTIIYNGKTHGGNDDLVMCTLLNIIMAGKFFEDERYKNERNS